MKELVIALLGQDENGLVWLENCANVHEAERRIDDMVADGEGRLLYEAVLAVPLVAFRQQD